MEITFISSCGTYEGHLEKLHLDTGTVWYLVTAFGDAYKFIGNLELLMVCTDLKMSALVHGECHTSENGLQKLEVIDIKPVFNYELGLMAGYETNFAPAERLMGDLGPGSLHLLTK